MTDATVVAGISEKYPEMFPCVAITSKVISQNVLSLLLESHFRKPGGNHGEVALTGSQLKTIAGKYLSSSVLSLIG